MHPRVEEDPDEPETEPERGPGGAPSALVVGSAAGASGTTGVEFEYRTEKLTGAEILDGTTLPEKLAKESADGWDLVDLLQVEDTHVILLRKAKKPEREERRVGFFSR